MLDCLVVYFKVTLSGHYGLPVVPASLFPQRTTSVAGIPCTHVGVNFSMAYLIVATYVAFFYLKRVVKLNVKAVITTFAVKGKVTVVKG